MFGLFVRSYFFICIMFILFHLCIVKQLIEHFIFVRMAVSNGKKCWSFLFLRMFDQKQMSDHLLEGAVQKVITIILATFEKVMKQKIGHFSLIEHSSKNITRTF